MSTWWWGIQTLHDTAPPVAWVPAPQVKGAMAGEGTWSRGAHPAVAVSLGGGQGQFDFVSYMMQEFL